MLAVSGSEPKGDPYDRRHSSDPSVSADHRRNHLSYAGSSRPIAELYLAKARPRTGFSRTPSLLGVLEPQHRGEAPFREGRASGSSGTRQVPSRQRVAASPLAAAAPTMPPQLGYLLPTRERVMEGR